MEKKFRVGIVGLEHGHVWGIVRQFLEHPNAQVVGIAETEPELIQQAKNQFGITAFYESAEALFDSAKPDIAVVMTDNAQGAVVTEAAANRGIHIFVEKPMAATFEQARRMMQAAMAHGIKLMVNWWTAWTPAYRHALELAKEGVVGPIHLFKFRIGHEGPKEIGCSPFFYNWLYDAERNGAGAYMDFCCYGANMASYLFGEAITAYAVAERLVKNELSVDDNGILILKFKSATAVLEGTWTQVGPGPSENPVMYGRDGTIAVQGDRVIIHRRGVREPEVVQAPALPAGRRNGVEYFMACLIDDRPVEGLVSAELGLLTQAALQAGLEAARTGREIPVS